MRRTHLTTIAALFAFVALVSVGCGKNKTKASSSTSTTAATAATAQGSIDVADQSSDGTKLTIASVTITNAPNGGWIALHIDSAGKPGPVMGKVHIPPGSSQNVVATFDTKQATGKFWPMLHVDDHQPNVYEFGTVTGADAPVTSGSDIVMKQITLTVA